MLPCQEIAWFRETNPEWISDWLKGVGSPRRVPDEEYLNYGPDQSEGTMRHEYLNGCLQISEIGDISVILLNPIIVDTSGDWETWDFSTFYPGAQRYRNFREFFEAAAAQLRADDMAV